MLCEATNYLTLKAWEVLFMGKMKGETNEVESFERVGQRLPRNKPSAVRRTYVPSEHMSARFRRISASETTRGRVSLRVENSVW